MFHNWNSSICIRQKWMFSMLMHLEKIYCEFCTSNSNRFFIIYVANQQPHVQLQAQHIVETDNYIMDKHNIKLKTS
jgi:hypothetical protein